MAKNDNNLAYALQQATESYSAGNIFGSGLALQKQRHVMQQNQAPDIKTGKDRRLDELDTNKDRAQFEMDEIVRPKIDMAKDDLEDRFRKARGRAPSVPTLQEFASRPDEYLTF